MFYCSCSAFALDQNLASWNVGNGVHFSGRFSGCVCLWATVNLAKRPSGGAELFWESPPISRKFLNKFRECMNYYPIFGLSKTKDSFPQPDQTEESKQQRKERREAALNALLRPLVAAAFRHHDRDQDQRLSREEARGLFRGFAERVPGLLEGMMAGSLAHTRAQLKNKFADDFEKKSLEDETLDDRVLLREDYGRAMEELLEGAFSKLEGAVQSGARSLYTEGFAANEAEIAEKAFLHVAGILLPIRYSNSNNGDGNGININPEEQMRPPQEQEPACSGHQQQFILVEQLVLAFSVGSKENDVLMKTLGFGFGELMRKVGPAVRTVMQEVALAAAAQLRGPALAQAREGAKRRLQEMGAQAKERVAEIAQDGLAKAERIEAAVAKLEEGQAALVEEPDRGQTTRSGSCTG
eukprot:g2219.t1